MQENISGCFAEHSIDKDVKEIDVTITRTCYRQLLVH